MAEALYRSPVAGLLAEQPTAGDVAFEDLTLASRAGVKGPNARAWLEGRGYGPLPLPNHAARTGSGLLVAMLGDNEALLLDRAARAALWSFGSGAAMAPGVYPAPRGEGTFWITASGAGAPDAFAAVCGVDLRAKSFRDLRVAQTMVAGASAIIIRDDALGPPGFHVLGDISLAPYLVRQILDAAQSA